MIFYINLEIQRFEIIKEVNLEANTIDSIGITNVDFVKIDIRCKLDALKGWKIIKGTIGLEIEVEFQKMYENQPLFGDINNYINDQEFEFIDFPLIKRWERNEENSYGQVIFADALFLRTPEFANKNFNIEKMSKYILILILYNKYDLFDKCKLDKFFQIMKLLK